MSNTCKQVSALISEQNAAASQVGISILDYYNKSQDVDKDTQPPPGFLNDIVEFSRRNATIIYTSDQMSIRRDIRSVFASKSDEPITVGGNGGRPGFRVLSRSRPATPSRMNRSCQRHTASKFGRVRAQLGPPP